MTPHEPVPEIPPDEAADFEEFKQRRAQLRAELDAGVLSPAEYQQLEAEAWEIYRLRTGRLHIEEDEVGGSPPDSAA
jgi:hypothetical protein